MAIYILGLVGDKLFMREALSGSKMPRMSALWLALALLAAVIIGGPPATASADTPVTVGGKAVVTNTDGDPIRVRQGAGTEFVQIATAYEGQTVSILEGPVIDKKGIRWFMLQAPGGTGWMMAEFLRGTVAPTTAPRLSGSAIVANTNGDPLRMRSAPNTDGKILTLLDPGTTVAIQDGPATDNTGIEWYKVMAKGLTGWTMAKYLAQAPTSAPAAPEPAHEEAAKKETPPQAEPVVVLKPVATATVAATATATAKPTEKPEPTPTAAPRPAATSTQAQYRQWMEEARTMYPYKQSVDKMWSVMMCESGGNARASGGVGRWLGLFQYAPTTWGGRWNPYRGNSIWDAHSQIFATAKAWSIGMQSHWSCYYITAGR